MDIKEACFCSFCGRHQDFTGKLIAGPDNANGRSYICDHCVELCSVVLDENRETSKCKSEFEK